MYFFQHYSIVILQIQNANLVVKEPKNNKYASFLTFFFFFEKSLTFLLCDVKIKDILNILYLKLFVNTFIFLTKK